ncbi:MAG: 8-oxoguanine deaminase [Sphaerochaetaceae bacterium]|nr:8-oxoguanine deaminase [Sphaerochaetaceae bacterium]MDC7237767.1 8-oxoguanine deaminase [Sphaerochaetaceae bacterium]MDC7243706.1 8-oxoguanine deaminase [Sphaerochaetaceae bacterium]
MSDKILLRDIHCLQTSFDKPSLSGADLLIEDGKVKKIYKEGKAKIDPACRVIDCSNHVVIPGMVNTHHHFYQTLTRNLPSVQNAELFDWLIYLYDIWKHIDEEAVYTSSCLAIGELLKTGCTTSTDHHYLYPRGFKGDLMGLQFEAADRLGMRFSPTRGSMSLSKKDGGLPPDSVVQTTDEILEDSERCIKQYHQEGGAAMHKIVLAPCSPFSVTKDLMKESCSLARKYGARIHTHLCETYDEADFCKEMYGVRPVELMKECDMVGEDVFFAHGIHFNDKELEYLRDTKCHIAHCPSSNMRLGSGICRVKEMKDLGINVGIAVDGSASNDSSDMLGELRNALLLQRVKYGAAAVTASDIFTMGTLGGAKMLGFDEVGLLEEGWQADIAIFDVSTLPYAGSHSDSTASLLFCGTNHNTAYTIVNGKVVVDEGKLVGYDENELAKKGREVSENLLKRAGVIE